MFGSASDKMTAAAYDVPIFFTENYPPCYIVRAKDDPVVPVRNSKCLKELLDQFQIPAKLELIETGGHGWGDGSGTDAAGWPFIVLLVFYFLLFCDKIKISIQESNTREISNELRADYK